MRQISDAELAFVHGQLDALVHGKKMINGTLLQSIPDSDAPTARKFVLKEYHRGFELADSKLRPVERGE